MRSQIQNIIRQELAKVLRNEKIEAMRAEITSEFKAAGMQGNDLKIQVGNELLKKILEQEDLKTALESKGK